MSNYRVRQIMTICKRYPQRQKDLLIGLATYLDDSTVEVRLGNDKLAEASGLHPDTVKAVKRELRKAAVIDYEPGRHRGDCTFYRVLILTEGGTSNTPPSEGGTDSTPPSSQKGGSDDSGRGGQPVKKGGVTKSADLQEPERGLNPWAKDSSSLSSVERAARRLLDCGGTEREIRHIADKMIQDPKVRYPAAYLTKAIEAGDGPVLLAQAQKDLDVIDTFAQLRETRARADAEAAEARQARQARINAQADDREPRDPEPVSAILAELRTKHGWERGGKATP